MSGIIIMIDSHMNHIVMMQTGVLNHVWNHNHDFQSYES